MAARRFGCSPDDFDRQLDASENENKVHCPYLSRERDKLRLRLRSGNLNYRNNLKEYINESKFIYHCISFAFDSL